jgi:hypothetical protein
MAAGPSSYQQRGARGAKLLSAYPRAIQDVSLPLQDIGVGLSTIPVAVPPALIRIPFAGVNSWGLQPNLLYRFDATLILYAANPNLIALESAALVAQLMTPNGTAGLQLVKQAELGALTALANANPINIDDFEIDCNDAIAIGPRKLSDGTLLTGQYSMFSLQLMLSLNNTGAMHQQISTSAAVKARAAQFDSYRFDTWD